MAERTIPRSPEVEYKDDEKDPENIVKITTDIPGLKKNMIGKKAANASIVLDFPTDRSFILSVDVKNKEKVEKWEYKIQQLPDEIDKSKSTFKVEKHEEIVIKLYKTKPRRWRELATIGLETA